MGLLPTAKIIELEGISFYLHDLMRQCYHITNHKIKSTYLYYLSLLQFATSRRIWYKFFFVTFNKKISKSRESVVRFIPFD